MSRARATVGWTGAGGLSLLGLVVLLLSPARGDDTPPPAGRVARFSVRLETAELRVAGDLGVKLVGFRVPGREGIAPFEASLVPAARLEAFRLLPHLYHVRLDGDPGRFWKLDAVAGRAWLVTEGVFGVVGGEAVRLPWVSVGPGPGGEGIRAALRDLELVCDVAAGRATLKGAGLEPTTHTDFAVEALAPSVFGVRSPSGWAGGRLEVDVGRGEVGLVRGGTAGTRDLPREVVDLPVAFRLEGGHYADADLDSPRLLRPPADATLDNGRTDGLDLAVREFRWTDVPGADAYEIHVRNRRLPEPTVAERTEHPYYREETRSCVGDHLEDGWEWRVRARRGKEELPWSETGTFRVEPCDTDPPDGSLPARLEGPENSSHAPRLLSPRPGAVLDNGREDGREPLVWAFRWTRMAKAREYEIAISRDTEYGMVRAIVKRPRFELESRTLRAFGTGRTGWHWRVRGLQDGEALPWSEAFPFGLEPLDSDPPEGLAEPPVEDRRRIPRLLSPRPASELPNGPEDRRGATTWTFRWTSVPEAETYEVQFHQRGARHGPRTVQSHTTSYRHEQTFEVQARACYGHTWRVRAVIDGVPQAWSEVWTYDVRPPGD